MIAGEQSDSTGQRIFGSMSELKFGARGNVSRSQLLAEETIKGDENADTWTATVA